jgi:phage-related protein
MPTQTITVPIQGEGSKQTIRRVRTVQFGDGFEQRVLDGINTWKDSWDVTFMAQTQADATLLENQIRQDLGHKSIYWQAPDEANPTVWIIRSYTKVVKAGKVNVINCRLERLYEA